jgi:hypothetical protein
MEKALFPGQDGSSSQICNVVCLAGVPEFFSVITNILPTSGVFQPSLIPNQRVSPEISSRLNLRFVGVIILGLSSFIILFYVPNMISRYTPDLPERMKCVLTSSSSFLLLYHYGRLSLRVYHLFATLFSPAGVHRFSILTNL